MIDEQARLPLAVDLRIIGQCNLSCPFCFGPRHTLAFQFQELWIDLIKALPEYGVKRVVFTGGEPMLVPELPLLLRTARDVGLHCTLSTNGTLFRSRSSQVLPLLDWVALPLDSIVPAEEQLLRPHTKNIFKTHETARNSNIDTIIEAFRICRRDYPSVRIKLGTVVTRNNLESVSLLPEYIDSRCGSPDTWKIYQVTKSSYASDNWIALSVNNQRFETVTSQAANAASNLGWHVVVYRNSQRAGKYLFIEPNGDAMVVGQESETIIGNAFSDLGKVAEISAAVLDHSRLWRNSTETYRSDIHPTS